MIRLGAIFIAVCVALIAASLGAIGYLYFRMSGAEASVLTLGTLTALALYNTLAARMRDRADVGAQIADLSRGSADLARQVAEMGRRIATIEHRMEGAIGKSRTAADPLIAEIGELGALVKELAETVALHDAAIKGEEVIIDGFNLLITIEAALSGGLILICRSIFLKSMTALFHA